MILFLPTALFSAEPTYDSEMMRRLLPSVFDHVELCMHGKKIAVSCSPDSFGMLDFMEERLYGKLRTIKETAATEAPSKCAETFSKDLCELFAGHNKGCADADYELWFSYPDHDRIACTIYPCGQKGSKTVTAEVFVFGYKPQGVIDFMTRTTVYFDER